MPARKLSTLEKDLWKQVELMWQWAREKNTRAIKAAIHPHYTGWDKNDLSPHDRDIALKSISTGADIISYQLHPLHIETFNESVGIIHYTYSAAIELKDKSRQQITGRWTEIYMKMDGNWMLIGVHGGPDE